jgi:two-component system response regulator HydG
VQLRIPPLRDRVDDIPLLVERFLAAARDRNPHTKVGRLDDELVAALARYAWPGNVRELENLVERLVVIGAGPTATVADLTELAPQVVSANRFALPRERMPTLKQLEEEYITWVLARCDGNKTRAAEILGIDVSTVHRRMR